ncbi:MAG: hypothetical protein L3K03_04655 [Thermoplasmata archaeon]|nr:hypothetical protein [Thermoplasmata archaeon]
MSTSRSVYAAIAALALVALFVVSSFNIVGAPHPTSPQTGVPPSIRTALGGTSTIGTTDQYGYPQYDYETGYSGGNVYFVAGDTAGDLSARVAINDLNASRDGLTNPLATWNVSFAKADTNYSTVWGAHYQLPLGLVDGGLWNITITATLGGTHHADFYVQTYTLNVEAPSSSVLPGQNVVLLYQVVSTANGGPYSAAAGGNGPTTAVSSIQVAGRYIAQNLSARSWFGKSPDSATPNAWGTFTAPMPIDVLNGTELGIDLWANVTSANINTTYLVQIAIGVGSLAPGQVGLELGYCPTNACNSGSFEAGSVVYLGIAATISGSGGTVPAAGLTATIDFVGIGSGSLGAIGSPATRLILNATGQAAIAFTANSGVFGLSKMQTINVTVSNPAVANTTATNSIQFDVVPSELAAPNLVVSFGQGVYQGGDSATVSWALGGQNATVPKGWTVNAWYSYESSDQYGPIVAQGYISSTGLAGTFTVIVPANYTGFFAVYVQASNASENIWAGDDVAILAPAIELTPNEDLYNPGDTLTVTVALDGASLTGATLYAYVYSDDFVFLDGVLNGTTITVQIPKVATPDWIDFGVTAVSSTQGVLTTQLLTIYEADQYELVVSVPTTSKYTDGSYQPGETITVDYHLIIFGLAQTPTRITFQIEGAYYTDGPEDIGAYALHASMPISGSVSYTIPSSTTAGSTLFYAVASFPSALCYEDYDEEYTPGVCSDYATFAVTVNPNPSALEYQVVPNSGLTVGWLILLVLIVVVTLVLWLLIRRGGSKPPTFSSGSSSPSSSSSSASSAGTGASGPAAWQPPSGGSSPDGPPLPNPPSGPGSS